MTHVTIVGQERLRAKLMRLAAGVANGVEADTVEAAIPVMQAAKRYAPKDTHALERSIHIGGHADKSPDYDGNYPRGPRSIPDPIVTTTRAEVAVGTDIVYGAQREYGGTITAKNAPRLVWRDKEGNWYSALSVYQEPTPYLRPAFDEAQGNSNWAKAFATSALNRIRGLIRG